MKNTVKKVLLMYLILCAPLADLSAQAVTYVYTEYYPANYLDSEGKPAGFFVEIVTEAFTRLGVPVLIKVYPWRRCQSLVESGKADLITTIPTNQRLAYSIPVKTPIWIKQYRIYTWAEHPEAARMDTVTGLLDLGRLGLTVISYLGNSWSDTALKGKGITVVDATSVEGMFKMLQARRGDIVIDDPILVDPALKALELDGKIVPTKGVVEESSFHLLISRKSPYVILTEDLDRTLTEMWTDGTIPRILERYRER